MKKSSLDLGKRATPADQTEGHRARMRGKYLKKALALMSIAIYDHLIVASTSCVSFKGLGHL
jgi:DNA repair protein RadC